MLFSALSMNDSRMGRKDKKKMLHKLQSTCYTNWLGNSMEGEELVDERMDGVVNAGM